MKEESRPRCFGTVNDLDCEPERECKTCPHLRDCVAEHAQRAYDWAMYGDECEEDEDELENEFSDVLGAELVDEWDEPGRGG